MFHRDLRENLIPYVESHYHTYAEDVTEEGLRASREHRAFGGFSLGAVTTWYQFIYNLDYIKYFVPMSGDCWIMGNYGGRNYPVETVDYLEQVVADGGWSGDDFYIYQGIGTSDPIWDQTDSQIQEMLTRDLFTADNLHYAIIQAAGMTSTPASGICTTPCRPFSEIKWVRMRNLNRRPAAPWSGT